MLQVVVAVVLAVEFSKFGSSLPNNVSVGVLVVICELLMTFLSFLGVSVIMMPSNAKESASHGISCRSSSETSGQPCCAALQLQAAHAC